MPKFFSQEYLEKKGRKYSDKEFTHDLLLQELKMWKLIGEQVSKEEFDFICNRRGFSKPNRGVLKEALKKLKLGNEL